MFLLTIPKKSKHITVDLTVNPDVVSKINVITPLSRMAIKSKEQSHPQNVTEKRLSKSDLKIDGHSSRNTHQKPPRHLKKMTLIPPKPNKKSNHILDSPSSSPLTMKSDLSHLFLPTAFFESPDDEWLL